MINLTREEAKQVLDALEKGAWDTLRGRNAADLLSARLSAPEPKMRSGYLNHRGVLRDSAFLF